MNNANLPSSLLSPTVLKSGILLKRSRNRNATASLSLLRSVLNKEHWDERLVLLHPTVIEYALVTGETKGTFDLSSHALIEKCTLDKKNFVIKISNAGEDFYLACANELVRQEWFTAIQSVINGDTYLLLNKSEKTQLKRKSLSLFVSNTVDSEILTQNTLLLVEEENKRINEAKLKIINDKEAQERERIEEQETYHAWGSGRHRTTSSSGNIETQISYVNSYLVGK